ncbi:hypothetical protein PENTCL1PPCAC_13944, partial [Pristionchus entomophagus]
AAMITLLWLLLLQVICSAAAAAADDPRLLQVQIIIRHADRAPMYEFTSLESAALFPRGLGELTNDGIRRATQQGSAFRQHYNELGLLSGKTTEAEIFIRSSPIKRVLMSATAFATSFIGKGIGRVHVPPIHTTESEDDERVLIVHDSVDHRCKVLARHNISDQPLCRAALLRTAIIKEYPDCASFNYTQIEASVAQAENPNVTLDAALEKCARGDARKIQFRSLSIRPGVAREFDASRAGDVIGPLMSIVSRNVDDAVKGDTIEGMRTGAPIRVYYTHDHNILAVAQALGIISEFGERNPEFSSAIAVETWSSSEGFDIKIVMKDGLKNPFKPVAKFRFLDFKNRISSYTDLDPTKIQWDDQAKNVYTFQQFGKNTGKPSTTVGPVIPRIRPATETELLEPRKSHTYEILLVASMLFVVVGVLLKRRNTYTRMY